jgi:hypothetical protein
MGMSYGQPQRKLLLLDTSVLLLWLTWQADPGIIFEFKRVANFTAEDGEELTAFVRKFHGFLSTPHVLAEASNHVDQAPMNRRAELMDAYKDFIRDVDEIFVEASKLIVPDHFNSLGLTDSGLISLSDRATILTTDWQLSNRILALGGRAVNFNHFRHLIS